MDNAIKGMSMDTLQANISEWAESTFDHDERGIALHTVREAVELALSTGKLTMQEIEATVSTSIGRFYRAGKEEREPLMAVSEEAADVAILLFALAGYMGFDLETCVVAKHIVNKAREWGEPDGQGITEHVD